MGLRCRFLSALSPDNKTAVISHGTPISCYHQLPTALNQAVQLHACTQAVVCTGLWSAAPSATALQLGPRITGFNPPPPRWAAATRARWQ